ncbi:DUF3122 domain-containing protein [Desertifilum sp. FACHB-1129]|nr:MULTISPECIES: DUF3122 domain-containing protein [Desertifilum]MBD2313433.1 DUF3122 domain-containing protein [Desertifilum sp. FACHB-1129]MBD2322303.1 DUF3122 domain-containing protein [Desertifilum sp. FACHB-866]MBD2332465.1 DUF3122 domain-containing protein [Desertifilum sp. FACHB-868]MDA0210964.1 DUF3122 domain-containing protein [Cyanobacteria bacterium FC1]
MLRIVKRCQWMLNLVKKINKIGILVLVFFSLSLAQPKGAIAHLQEHHQQSGQLSLHSRQTLRDRAGYAWQVVLFPGESPSDPRWNLRLVGFPGAVEVAHPQPLTIRAAEGMDWSAADVFRDRPAATSVGQYDFTEVMQHLESVDFLIVQVPVSEDRTLSLKIPPFLIAEWQQLARSKSSPERSHSPHPSK